MQPIAIKLRSFLYFCSVNDERLNSMITKEVTIYDIAAKLKISSATVSRALKDDPVVNAKTKKRIFDAANKMGYRTNQFARSLRSQKTHIIGVIVPRLNSYFMSSVISGIEQVANSEGYNIVISQSSEQANKEIANARTMFNNRVDGLLVSLAYDTNNIDHFEPFFKKNVPVIFFDRVEAHKNSTNIVIDNRRAAYNATSHLIKEGCKRIVHITATPKRNVYADRLAGYKQALADHDIKFKDEYLIITSLSQDAGADAAERILALKPFPDGVFVSNDNCAVGCMLAMKKAGIRIPQDIAFAGFNNDPVCTVIEPNLTSVNYSGYQVGEVAARSMIQHLKGMTIDTTGSIILRSELIVRESSKRKSNE
jgi:LacI family transcriptional regulator